jgi:hypothetical protein
MARQEYGNVDGETILCPLFKSFNANEIRCASHVPDASSVVIKYRRADACETQRKIFCEREWKRCEHYRSWKHMRWDDE